ncbi:extracellular solute-binding protein [Paenibacillus lycopersici]|uniref:Extracellular solute-binding protein n=1 Tax=Paenibacillus lycopersici TaxID=2704462 RepID=A0A6C0G422_9BACL|nr:extracellular solute-binding protein [Paenibacillus lycopersici]QHT61480.1 extracellular solute-binding protein [Paenibacillus lycopersici]
MNGRATIRRAVTLGIAAILAAALGGCSGAGGGAGDFGSGGSGSAEKGAARLADTVGGQAADLGSSGKAEADSSIAGTAAQKPITLKVELNSTGKDFESTEVYDEITRMTGVTMDIQTYDEQKFKVELAGGNLPDIIQVPNKNIKELIEGNNILPLDDLVKAYGPDIAQPVLARSLDYIRRFWSDGKNKLYMVPVQVGSSGFGFQQETGLNVRWDYYKELGYPRIRSIDDMVNVIAEMVQRHPETEDGSKTYGVSMWNDWGTWSIRSIGLITGGGVYDVNTGQLVNDYTDPDHSAVWDMARFLYLAQQRGILDPDAFTAKYNDIVAEASKGTLLSAFATWPFAYVNAELLRQGPDKGFVTLPLDWGFTNVGGSTVAGWSDRAWAITSNCKDPGRAMALINFLVSEQGSRLIASGIQGRHWDYADGVPQMKPETAALAAEGGDSWKRTGIGMFANQQGFTDHVVTNDGGIVNLFESPEMYKAKMNSLYEDYDRHYGVTYPAEAYKRLVEQGKVKTLDQVPQDILNAMPPKPDDIIRIQSKLDELLMKGMPVVVLGSANDAEFAVNEQKLIDQLVDAGADRYFAWFKRAFEETKAKMGRG